MFVVGSGVVVNKIFHGIKADYSKIIRNERTRRSWQGVSTNQFYFHNGALLSFRTSCPVSLLPVSSFLLGHRFSLKPYLIVFMYIFRSKISKSTCLYSRKVKDWYRLRVKREKNQKAFKISIVIETFWRDNTLSTCIDNTHSYRDIFT